MRTILCLVAVMLMLGCSNKKKGSVSGEDPVSAEDFVASFPLVKLPYQFSDTTLTRKKTEPVQISYKVFTQFVPDSVAKRFFGNAKPRIYPMGRAGVEDGENYLFAKIVSSKPEAYVIAFDKKNNFLAMMPVLQPDANAATQQSFVLDRKYTLSKSITRKNADGTLSDGKEVYGLFGPPPAFTLIMTEALDEKNTELINPIDTLPKKHKLAGDYITGKRNIVSVRDNKKTDRLSFFIHMEKNNGDCTGELKGEAILTSANTAVFRPAGDPCTLEFKFSSSTVTITEQGCGSHRGIDCLFDGSFQKKKQAKVKKVK